LPEVVVQRAREVLNGLDDERSVPAGMPDVARSSPRSTPQLDLFSAPRTSAVEKVLEEVDLERVTPIEALALLARLKQMAEGG
jgi:DNA mismatch repair ATPase MutS